jgi:hypothetical protein
VVHFATERGKKMTRWLEILLLLAPLVGATVEPSIKECIKGMHRSYLLSFISFFASGSENGENWKRFHQLFLYVL